MKDIKIYKNNDKLEEAYNILVEKINALSHQYQLTYFDLFGLIECFKIDLIKTNINEEDLK